MQTMTGCFCSKSCPVTLIESNVILLNEMAELFSTDFFNRLLMLFDLSVYFSTYITYSVTRLDCNLGNF